MLTKLEPFLEEFWLDDIAAQLRQFGGAFDKNVAVASEDTMFFRFYRVTTFRIAGAATIAGRQGDPNVDGSP